MSASKRILILTADAGFGHRSTANAVAAALNETDPDCLVEIINPLDDKRVPFFLRDSGSDYDKIVRAVPELYRLGYDASDSAVPVAIADSAMVLLLFEVLHDILRDFQPDAILNTYPLYQAPLAALYTIRRISVPTFTVVTDLVTVHRVWFNRNMDGCLVPTSQVRDLAVANGVPPEKIYITGLPVHPSLALETRSKQELRRELGWDEHMTTILAVGSRRVEGLVDALHVVNHFGAPLQLCVVAGKDKELYDELTHKEWHQPHVHLYEFSDSMPTMMHAADLVMSKAGGLVVTESLACGKPMILINVIPGQETGNADYIVSGGAADLAVTQMELLETLSHWMANDAALLRERTANAAVHGRPQAAHEVARMLLQAAQTGQVDHRKRHIAGRPKLIELLKENGIKWRERLLQTEKTD